MGLRPQPGVPLLHPISVSYLHRKAIVPGSNQNSLKTQMKTILVIEDNAAFRRNILRFLELENFYGIAASDGFAGLQLAQTKYPDLIICDLELPEIDGFSILNALRNNPSIATTPFIFLCDNVENCRNQSAGSCRADVCLSKPIQLKSLSQAIREQLSRKPLANQVVIP